MIHQTQKFRRSSLVSVIVISTLATTFFRIATGQTPAHSLVDDPRYTVAIHALDENIPQVSIQKLKECLNSKLTSTDRQLTLTQLGKAFLAAGRVEDALRTVEALTIKNPNVDFLKAQALAALGRWNDACPIYHQLAAQTGSQVSYKIGEAECLHATGKKQDAIKALESVLSDGNAPVMVRLRLADFYLEEDQIQQCETIFKSVLPATPAESKWAQYIRGRLMLSKRRYSEAFSAFEDTLKTKEGLSANLLVGATLGMTDARFALSGPESAGNVLEEFISQNLDIAGVDILFGRLDQIYAAQKAPSESELQKWSEKTPPTKSSVLATYYLAKAFERAQKPDRALAAVGVFISANPKNPLIAQAYLLKGNILVDQGKWTDAIESFDAARQQAADPELLAQAEMAAGMVHFRQNEFEPAQQLFQSAAQHSDRLWQRAVFNSALSWLKQTNYDRFSADYRTLSARYPESDLRAELVLEEGLLQARLGDQRAVKSLQGFIHDFPRHPRVTDALLALAEIAYLSPDQSIASANRYLKASNETPESGDKGERALYLAIYLADSTDKREDESVISSCQQFIKEFPASTMIADVRMKLGQVYFRRQNFPNAQEQFEFVARQMPTSSYTDAAFFLAGQSALKTMNADQACDLFQEVAKHPGPLQLYARQQQAIVKSRLGSEEDAIKLYDIILADKPEADLKFAAYYGRGYNYLLLGARDVKFFDKAIEAFDELANQPDVTAYWRNQALYQKGKCYEALTEQDEVKNDPLQNAAKESLALEAFYDVMEPHSSNNDGPDYIWFYRAGFEAAHILESREQWKAAIAIYQKMAVLEGPRSGEAKELLGNLRLKHFIWD